MSNKSFLLDAGQAEVYVPIKELIKGYEPINERTGL